MINNENICITIYDFSEECVLWFLIKYKDNKYKWYPYYQKENTSEHNFEKNNTVIKEWIKNSDLILLK